MKLRQWMLVLVGLISFCSVYAGDPQLILPAPSNKDGRELSYSYAVLAPAKYRTKAEKLLLQITQCVAKEKLAFTALDGLKLLPDVVFVLDDSSDESKTLIATAEQQGALTMKCPISKVSAKEAFELLKKRYYSGQRPEYSTLFTAGEGYNNYRIPSVTVTKHGTIVAFAEARAFGRDQAENDIVSRRSVDGGKTWSNQVVVAEEGESSLNNPVAIYLEKEDRILLMYQSYPPKLTEGVSRTSDGMYMRSYLVYSDDQGATWSKPRELTRELCPEGISQFCTGPGVGIEVKAGAHKGRLIVPCNAVTPMWFNYLAYSDDRGETWHITKENSSYGSNESQVVQTGDNEFLICARYHIYAGDKSFLAPKGWSPWHFDKVVRNRALIRLQLNNDTSIWSPTESRVDLPDALCQGSIVRYGDWGNGEKSILLMANSASQYSLLKERPYSSTAPMRVNGSVRYSLDEGHTWSVPKRIYGNRFTEYQYSVLVPLPDNKVGCIFEANENIKFAVFDMEWLMN